MTQHVGKPQPRDVEIQSKPGVHLQVRGWRRCSSYMEWNIIQPLQRTSAIYDNIDEVGGVMLCELSQAQKDILHVLTYMWTLNAESRMVVSGGGGGGEEWGDVGQRVWSFGG